MPLITRLFIKSSLAWFVIALMTGAGAVLLSESTPLLQTAITPVYVHMLVLGWVTQLIFGVVYWMFPKYSMQNPRGSERLGWVTYGCLNLGLLLRILGEPLHLIDPSAGWGLALVFAAVLLWLAGLAFVVNTWSRVKER